MFKEKQAREYCISLFILFLPYPIPFFYRNKVSGAIQKENQYPLMVFLYEKQRVAIGSIHYFGLITANVF